MPYRQIANPDPKFLAATDILIGDMSDTNNEFLLYDRPIILLANDWLRKNFPDIGIKTDIDGLEESINRSNSIPNEYKKNRGYWLKKTVNKPDGTSSKRCIDTMVKKSEMDNPSFVIIHGSDVVRKSNLSPLVRETEKQGFKTSFVSFVMSGLIKENTIFVAAHIEDLNIPKGYKVHFDHGLKGQGTANVEVAKKQYSSKNYFPFIDLHITAGEMGQKRTEMLLGPLHDRAVMVGYPKSDDLIKKDTIKNKNEVYKMLKFDIKKPLITYAPAGEEKFIKPGGSLSKEVLKELKRLSSEYQYNILVKLKSPDYQIIFRLINKIFNSI